MPRRTCWEQVPLPLPWLQVLPTVHISRHGRRPPQVISAYSPIQHAPDGDCYIYTVQQWTGKFFLIVDELFRGANAGMVGRIMVTTWAGIHGRDEHDVGGVGNFLADATDGYTSIF